MNMRTPIAFAAALALAGCTMIPKYERPPLPVPDEFPRAGRREEWSTTGERRDRRERATRSAGGSTSPTRVCAR